MKSLRDLFMLLLIFTKCDKGIMELHKVGCAIGKIGSLTISNSFTISCDLNSPITAGVIIQTPGGKTGNCLIPVRVASFGCPSQMSQDIDNGVTNWTVSAASTSEHNGTWTCNYKSTTFSTVVIIIYMDTDPVFSYSSQSKIFVSVGDQNYQTFTYTTGCMYPKPSFTWEYVNSRNNATLLTVSASASHTEDLTTDCSATNANAKVFKSTLIGKYEETLAGKTTKLKVSVTFQDDTQCFITELDKLSGEIVFQGRATTEGETTSTEPPTTSSIVTTTIAVTPRVTTDSTAASIETTTLTPNVSTTISITQSTKGTMKPISKPFWTAEITSIVAVSLVGGFFVIIFVIATIVVFVRRRKTKFNDKQEHVELDTWYSSRRYIQGHRCNNRPEHYAGGYNHGYIARQSIYDTYRGNAQYHHPGRHRRSYNLDQYQPRSMYGDHNYRFTKDYSHSPYYSMHFYIDGEPYELYTGGRDHGRHGSKEQQPKQLVSRRNQQYKHRQQNSYPATPSYNDYYSYPYY